MKSKPHLLEAVFDVALAVAIGAAMAAAVVRWWSA